MHQIQLTDEVYELAKRRADEAGFPSVDEYIVDILGDNESDDTGSLSWLIPNEPIAFPSAATCSSVAILTSH